MHTQVVLKLLTITCVAGCLKWGMYTFCSSTGNSRPRDEFGSSGQGRIQCDTLVQSKRTSWPVYYVEAGGQPRNPV